MMDLVAEIKERTDLVALISATAPLRKRGENWAALCPFHEERTPSFSVNPGRGRWKCFGCGKGGDCFAFVMQKEGVGFDAAGEFLANRLGLKWVPRAARADAPPGGNAE